MEDHQQQHKRELHFLSTTTTTTQPSVAATASTSRPPSSTVADTFEGPPSLDLQLSISVVRPTATTRTRLDSGYVEALRWQAAEQIRLAAMEKAYAERVRELTRREIEMAQSEFARARSVWERAKEEVKKAEMLKERATARIMGDSATCMEITCHSCSQKFRSYPS